MEKKNELCNLAVSHYPYFWSEFDVIWLEIQDLLIEKPLEISLGICEQLRIM